MTDRRVVVTGARKGIGRYLAEQYLERGDHVVGCSRGESDLVHDRYTHFCLDVSNEAALKGMFSDVRKRLGGLDALINNAGAASMNHALLTPLSSVERLVQTNFTGTFLCCREGAKLMRRTNNGRIVNFTTVAVPLKLEGEAVYAATKSAVATFTQVLANELGSSGITVNAVGPTPIETDLIRSVPKDKIASLLDRQAIRRLGTFDDVLNIVDFFLSPTSNFVTGQIIYLGGV